DPFGAADRPADVPEDEDASVLYQQAWGMLKRFEQPDTSWPAAEPWVRAWLEESREALELWRRATDRPRSSGRRPEGGLRPGRLPTDRNYFFATLALLEASRLEEGGDVAGAWGWYRAILRSFRHVGGLSPMVDRPDLESDMGLAPRVGERIGRWAADPRVDAR